MPVTWRYRFAAARDVVRRRQNPAESHRQIHPADRAVATYGRRGNCPERVWMAREQVQPSLGQVIRRVRGLADHYARRLEEAKGGRG